MATHRINRVEIEIEVGAVEQGQALIERLSQLHPRRIAPLIDRVCSDFSGPARHDRIDTLELELGPIALDDFDDEFIRALEAALRSALSRQLARQTSERPETGAYELLESFARTGNLPWWAAREQDGLIAEQIQALLSSTSERWFDLLRTLADDSVALVRLALHCDEAEIAAIAARAGLASERVDQLHELERWLADVRVLGSSRVAASKARGAWLSTMALEPALPSERAGELLLAELIALAPIVIGPLRRTITGGRAGEEPSSSAPSWLRRAAANLLPASEAVRRHPPAVEREEVESSNSDSTITARSEPAEEAIRAPEIPESSIPRSEVSDSEVPESQIPESEAPESEARDPLSIPADPKSPDLVEPSDIDEPSAAIDESREIPESAQPEPAAPGPRARRFAPPREGQSSRATRRRALDRLETLYVDDAGLVIVWPFLERFFVRVGLLDLDRRFVDEQAVMQAIALLSQLAYENADPPEFRLSLAKLLCGLSPEDPFVLERPLVPEQIDECDRLLAAVIENAPILRDTSIASFRTSFLQRPGALSIHEGAWQLEVEQQPHDLVLERFPWSWAWVKLAWMPDPLFVRW